MDYISKCKARNNKTLRGKHRKNTDINHRKIFFDLPSTVMKIRTKINKWGLIKLKSFCTAKKTINEMKPQPSKWKKILANEINEINLQNKNKK